MVYLSVSQNLYQLMSSSIACVSPFFLSKDLYISDRSLLPNLRATPMVFYELALSILSHILIEKREKLSLDQELASLVHIF
jgi:hypothetical protein